MDDAVRRSRRRTGHARDAGPSQERRLPDVLARARLRSVRGQPTGAEGVDEWQEAADLPAGAGGTDHVPPPRPDRGRVCHATADRDVLPGFHAVTAVPQAVKCHPADNVVVAVRPLVAGCEVVVDDDAVVLRDAVPAGHKIAIRTVEPGEPVVKYGFPIGVATAAIPPGAWVHTHNLKTCLDGVEEYRYQPAGVGVRHAAPLPPGALDGQRATPTFAGYRRRNGRVGTRNEVWILNTVGCVNHAAEQIGRTGAARFAGRIDGVFSFSHPYGCSQLGDDLQNTQRILAGLLRHPNAGGVLVLGLGCENNQLDELLRIAGDVDRERLRFFNSQEVSDEIEAGLEGLADLVEIVERDKREACPASDLIHGHKCGGGTRNGAGLSLLESPGNDGVSSTALVASGATLLLFTTGRGTPLGFPVPTLKISSNTEIAVKKPHWIDFNAGVLLDGTATMDRLEEDLFALILDVASGRALANNEKYGYREIAIWKEGVTL